MSHNFTMNNNESLTVSIAERISPHLALRNLANSFFDWLEDLPNDNVVVDFADVRSISRSFAHEYVKRKKSSAKSISEVRVPVNVTNMLKIIENPTHQRDILNVDSIRVLTV